MYNKGENIKPSRENNMEEFIEQIEERLGRDCLLNKVKKLSRLRELMKAIFSAEPSIKILEGGCDAEGDIHFEVLTDSLGIDYNNLLKYKPEISSDFFVNFIGEYLVRENMEAFVKVAENLKDSYHSVVNKYEHKKFGMKIQRGKLIFIFHISLIQGILTEDFKRVK